MKPLILASIVFFLNLLTANAQHKVIFISGETMTGKVVSILNDELVFNFKGNELKFPVGEIKLISFSEEQAIQNQTLIPKLEGKGILAGTITYLFNYTIGDKPDAGATVFICRVEKENSIDSLYNRYYESKHCRTMIAMMDKQNPDIKAYKDRLEKLGIFTDSDFNKLDEELSQRINLITGSDKYQKTTVDGTGNYSLKADPGYYDIIVKSKGRTALSNSEISGLIFVKWIEIRSNETIKLDHRFVL